MKALLCIALAWAFAGSAIADWAIEQRTDSMNDEVSKSAVVVNQQGNTLVVYRQPNGTVWMNFRLAETSVDQIAPEQTLALRIDKFKAHTFPMNPALTMQMKRLGLQLYAWEPKWVNLLIWHGKEEEGRNELLNELMQGSNVVFRYYIFTGGYKETTFALKGAESAIVAALSLGERLPPSGENARRDYRKVYADAMTACSADRSRFRACFERASACGKQHQDDAAGFQQCLQ